MAEISPVTWNLVFSVSVPPLTVYTYTVEFYMNGRMAVECNYHILSRKCPWALENHGPKLGGGRLHGEAICTYMYNVDTRDHIESLNMGMGTYMYMEMGAYSGDYGILKSISPGAYV